MTSTIGVKKLQYPNGTNALTVNSSGVITFDQKIVSASTDSSTFAGRIMANGGITAYGSAGNGVNAAVKLIDENDQSATIGITNAGHVYFQNTTDSADFIFQNSSGTVNMKVRWDGYVTKPRNPAFAAYRDDGEISTGTDVLYAFNETHFNEGSHYNTSNARFTAPVAGQYLFTVCTLNRAISDTGQDLALRKNGSHYMRIRVGTHSAHHHSWDFATIMKLSTNDYIDVVCRNDGAYGTSSLWTNFCGAFLG